MKQLKLALSFLTVIPVRITAALQPGDLGRSAAWFPLVGLLIGALLAFAFLGLVWPFPAPLAAVLVVALWAGLTGGLHLDGLADCCDGLLASVTPERRLEIMKDPRLGTFGGAGLILLLLVKAGAVAAIAQAGLPPLPAWVPLAVAPLAAAALLTAPLLLAPVLGRWLILIVARQPMARPGGLGAEFALGLTRRAFLSAAALPLALSLAGGPRGILAAALAHLVALGVIRLARARLGGVTGDVLGLTVELSEAAVLLVFAAR
jgi:adenosylcobinamide-GDP ribazoletransferase